MTPSEAGELLANTMNRIEAAGYLLYPHPRPVAISIRKPKNEFPPVHPDYTITVSQVWDQGDGKGWQVRVP